MRTPRWPTPVGLAFVAASTAAAYGQFHVGLRIPAVFVVFAAMTVLALWARTDRWTTALALLHLLVAATSAAPLELAQWAHLVLVATSLAAMHVLAPWVPWRFEDLRASAGALAIVGRRVLACGAIGLAAATLAAGLAS